jgi:hypothetical protein
MRLCGAMTSVGRCLWVREVCESRHTNAGVERGSGRGRSLAMHATARRASALFPSAGGRASPSSQPRRRRERRVARVEEKMPSSSQA